MIRSAILATLAVACLGAPSAAQNFSEKLIEGVEEQWLQVEGKSIASWSWRDKSHFKGVYDKLRLNAGSLPEQLETAVKAMRKLAKKHRGDEHFQWRAHWLVGCLLLDSEDAKGALKELEKAISEYPDEKYTEPSKHSAFQHIANDAAGAVWVHEGVDAAEEFALKLLRKDERFHYLYEGWWSERYKSEGLEERYAEFAPRLVEAYRYRQKKYKADSALADRNARRLESLVLARKRLVGGDPNKAYYLLAPPPEGKKKVERDLVLLLPGAHGQAKEFLPWLTGVHAEACSDMVFAVISAPQWSEEQKQGVVWVSSSWMEMYPEAKFPTEELVRAVRDDVLADADFKPRKVFIFAWSSSGPATYATALQEDAPYGRLLHPFLHLQARQSNPLARQRPALLPAPGQQRHNHRPLLCRERRAGARASRRAGPSRRLQWWARLWNAESDEEHPRGLRLAGGGGLSRRIDLEPEVRKGCAR